MAETNEHYGSEPLNSPMSRGYFCPKTEQIINCAMGLKHHIDVEELKKAFSDSVMLNHPRFCSLMVRDHNGIECWERVQVNIDEHIIVHHLNTAKTRFEDEEVEAELNAYLADISVSTPLSENKPLWEVHVLMGLKCVVFRMHHGLGDGASLMSMLNACFGEKNHDYNNINVNNDDSSIKSNKRSWRKKNVWGLIQALWLTLVFGLRLIGGLLWVKNKQNVFSGGDGVESLPRKLVTAKFKLQDFKCVKNVIPSATINDVLLGAISCGISKYLEIKSLATPQGLVVTAIVAVNLRKDAGLQKMSILMETTKANSSSFGNKTGSVLLPIRCYNGLHPLEHVKAMKSIMDQKKKSYEANLPFIFLKLLTLWFSPKVASWCACRGILLCNTSFVISNIMGPSKEIIIGNNPVTLHLMYAMTMHLVSYRGNADLQLMVAKDIIHDPEFLANCIQGSLNEMIEELHHKNDKINSVKN